MNTQLYLAIAGAAAAFLGAGAMGLSLYWTSKEKRQGQRQTGHPLAVLGICLMTIFAGFAFAGACGGGAEFHPMRFWLQLLCFVIFAMLPAAMYWKLWKKAEAGP